MKREEIRVKNPKYSIWNGQSQYLTEEKLLFRQVSFSKSIRAGLLIKKDTSADKTFVACDVHSWNDDLAAEETSANRKFQDYNGFNYLKMFAVRIVEAVKRQENTTC